MSGFVINCLFIFGFILNIYNIIYIIIQKLYKLFCVEKTFKRVWVLDCIIINLLGSAPLHKPLCQWIYIFIHILTLFLHPLPFSLYLRHGFQSESENVEGIGLMIWGNEMMCVPFLWTSKNDFWQIVLLVYIHTACFKKLYDSKVPKYGKKSCGILLLFLYLLLNRHKDTTLKRA